MTFRKSAAESAPLPKFRAPLSSKLSVCLGFIPACTMGPYAPATMLLRSSRQSEKMRTSCWVARGSAYLLLFATSCIPLHDGSSFVSSRMIFSTTRSSSKSPTSLDFPALQCPLLFFPPLVDRLDGAEAGRTMLPPPPSQVSRTYSADHFSPKQEAVCTVACADADIGLFLSALLGGLAIHLRMVDCQFHDSQNPD